MASTSSLTISQALLARAISHHASSQSTDNNRLSLSTLPLPAFSGLKSTSHAAAASPRRLPTRNHLHRSIRAAAVETVDVTTETSLVEKSVNTIRFLAIDAVEKANSGHPGLPMGCAPMGHILYDEVMRYNPKNPYWFNRDRFVLSAGHGCMLQYALLHLAGYDSVQEEDLKGFRQWGSKTPGHPENFETPGVEVTTGPLGQGIANAVGLALVEKHLAARYNKPDSEIVDHYTYAILGDGCQMEGIANEACSLAGHWGLGKLIAFYDDNHISIDGDTEIAFTESVDKRFEGLGWHVIWVKNGNTGYDEIRAAIKEAKAVKDKPTLIKVTTTIGFGSPNKANSYSVHGSALGAKEVDATRKNLGWPYEPFHVPEDVKKHWSRHVPVGAGLEAEWNSKFAEYEKKYKEEAAELKSIINGEFPAGWEKALPGDGSWHGGCLALAELARRGLLLPSSLPKVVPVVVKALHYDIRRGSHSVGSHVRDAAAYVCWAFGRAYYHTDMRNILEQLAPHLLSVGCYDREVNCRRAAAAAFQENVGRQGNYPHGIDIVNTADYFSLSSRVNSYLLVAVSIAQYEGYLYPFVEELMFNKICHWDKVVRELAAEALSALVKYEPEYFAHFVVEKLIPYTLSTDLCTRHGATLAVGEVVLALHQCEYALSADIQKRVAGVIPSIEKARLYRGKGGEIMRSAVSRFIECISLSHLSLPEKTKRSLLDTLNENLRHPNSQIQNTAVKALKHFVKAYFVSSDKGVTGGLTSKYLEQLNDPNVAVRRGSTLAIGVLPYEVLAKMWRDVLLKLCSCCAIEVKPEDRDVEARVNAVKGLISVCETLTQAREDSSIRSGEDDISVFHLIKDEVMSSLFKAVDDYSVDNRGDVGSWVREAALYGLEICTYILCKRDSMSFSKKPQGVEFMPEMPSSPKAENSKINSFFDANLATSLVGGIIKQAVEKMDKLREAAAKVLQRILYHETVFVPFIPYREKLEEIVPNKADLKWGVPTFSYPRFVQLLKFSCYSRDVLSGLVISTGGLQDSLSKASISALLKYLQVVEAEDLNGRGSREYMLCNDILWVLQKYKKCDRVIIPTLKTIEILFSKKIFLNMEAHTPTFCAGILDSLAIELRVSKDFSKLYTGIAILGYIASISEPINSRAFSHLLTFLGHRYPKIRKASAEQVYLVLLQNSSLMPEDKIEKALEIIAETCWEGDVEAIKHQRLELYDLVGLDTALFNTANKASSKDNERRPVTTDENASYSSLVGSSGF
ncbi:hypothetical protein JRO89_XS01G0298000 [Xanthoceras sorbifolium]|uniref:Transketolase n=1 Tax=Xanthoceras sorbifolium TaxID=99658 RepID=A0ABQ8IM58_9ROSI|nr:hypothetical protein JRO89_XS01G0298000 [Xanthoceras sorbifolium]